MSNQLNFDELQTLITAAVQQLGVAQGYMPFSHYRDELINQLSRQVHLLENYKESRNGRDNP